MISFDEAALPHDHRNAILAGRVLRDDGPLPVLVRDGIVYDISRQYPTIADLIDSGSWNSAMGEALCPISGLGAPGSHADFALLSPIDLQCVKAAGVTFAVSAVERVIEERARGDATRAAAIRSELETRAGDGIRSVIPGSEASVRLKAALIDAGMWSQYLEVAIGPDAEIFTKAPVLSTVGWGADIGVRSDSDWNNPEPEIVVVVNSRGKIVGATLGNDVNLRDFEGRSALLLGKAKDNNASCALGPFIRLFDDSFSLDDVRSATIALTIEGEDSYRLEGQSAMHEISRDPEDLVRQALSEHHYPDGLVLFLGTLFAPVQDRDLAGRGFTHKRGDIVTIRYDRLGALVNRVTTSKDAAPWTYGIRELIRTLATRAAHANT